MSRLNRILNITQPNKFLIARVSELNIYPVVAAETTAVNTRHTNQDLNNCENVILICNELVIGVGKIDTVRPYCAEAYSNIFTSKSPESTWKSEIKFSDFIPIGMPIKDIFGDNSPIKNIVTVGYLSTPDEVNSLAAAVNTFHGFHIKQTLSSMGIE